MILGIVLGITLEGGGGNNPVPPPPTPSNYNPYSVLPLSVTNYEYKLTGYFTASNSEVERLNAQPVGD